MTWMQRLAARLWWGPLRRPFRGAMRLVLHGHRRVLLGSARGCRFEGSPSQLLGIYEPHVQQALEYWLAPRGVFYDVGANTGYFSLLTCLRAGQGGCVYAFEPLPENIRRMESMLAENRLSNCSLIPAAVSDRSGTALLHFDADSNTPSLIGSGSGRSFQVRTITLDEFSQSARWPDLVKVDVEGAETLVLAGAARLLACDRSPVWIVEVHSALLDQQVRQCFVGHGYNVQDLVCSWGHPDPYPVHIVAWKDRPA